jgi:hypothetical protein
MGYRIGYIDENIEQVNKYTRRLRPFGLEVIGYDIKQGLELNDLMKQVYESNIDLLMIDYKLNESNVIHFNGNHVEAAFYENKPLFPHIIFTNKRDLAENFVEDWKIIFDKTEAFLDKKHTERFVMILSKSIEQYRKYVSKKKELISELLEKGEKEGLTAKDKNLLLNTQIEIESLDKTQKQEVPRQLISDQKLEDISKTKKDAEAFLQSLIENKNIDESKK